MGLAIEELATTATETGEYPLAIEDVEAFLAIKRADEVIGICGNATYCVLSETLNWLYPGKSWRVDIGSYDCCERHSSQGIRLSGPLDELRKIFDFDTRAYHSPHGGPITKAEFMRAWENWKEIKAQFQEGEVG